MRQIVPPTDWSVEEDNTLILLIGKGKSALQISSVIGRTRSAICGRAKRKGLKFKGGHAGGGKRAVAEPAKAKRGDNLRAMAIVHKRAVLKAVPIDVEPSGELVALVDLRPGQCKFPIGDPLQPGFGFCGAAQAIGFVYCGHHARRAYDFRCERAA